MEGGDVHLNNCSMHIFLCRDLVIVTSLYIFIFVCLQSASTKRKKNFVGTQMPLEKINWSKFGILFGKNAIIYTEKIRENYFF